MWPFGNSPYLTSRLFLKICNISEFLVILKHCTQRRGVPVGGNDETTRTGLSQGDLLPGLFGHPRFPGHLWQGDCMSYRCSNRSPQSSCMKPAPERTYRVQRMRILSAELMKEELCEAQGQLFKCYRGSHRWNPYNCTCALHKEKDAQPEPPMQASAPTAVKFDQRQISNKSIQNKNWIQCSHWLISTTYPLPFFFYTFHYAYLWPSMIGSMQHDCFLHINIVVDRQLCAEPLQQQQQHNKNEGDIAYAISRVQTHRFPCFWWLAKSCQSNAKMVQIPASPVLTGAYPGLPYGC